MDLNPRRETFGQADYGWLDSAHGIDGARSVTIDISKFTAGTHYPNGYLPSGTPLGVITATGLYGLYDDAASDGRTTLVGFLLEPIKATAGQNPIGALLEHGRINKDLLPFAIDAAGVANLAGRFVVLTGGI